MRKKMGLKQKILKTAIKTLIVSKAVNIIGERLTDFAIKKEKELTKKKIQAGVDAVNKVGKDIKDGIEKNAPDILSAVNAAKEAILNTAKKFKTADSEKESEKTEEIKPNFTTLKTKEEVSVSEEKVKQNKETKFNEQTTSLDIIKIFLENPNDLDKDSVSKIMKFIITESVLLNKDLVLGNAENWFNIIKKDGELKKEKISDITKNKIIAREIEKILGKDLSTKYLEINGIKDIKETVVKKAEAETETQAQDVKKVAKKTVAKKNVKTEAKKVVKRVNKVADKTSNTQMKQEIASELNDLNKQLVKPKRTRNPKV